MIKYNCLEMICQGSSYLICFCFDQNSDYPTSPISCFITLNNYCLHAIAIDHIELNKVDPFFRAQKFPMLDYSKKLLLPWVLKAMLYYFFFRGRAGGDLSLLCLFLFQDIKLNRVKTKEKDARFSKNYYFLFQILVTPHQWLLSHYLLPQWFY